MYRLTQKQEQGHSRNANPSGLRAPDPLAEPSGLCFSLHITLAHFPTPYFCRHLEEWLPIFPGLVSYKPCHSTKRCSPIHPNTKSAMKRLSPSEHPCGKSGLTGCLTGAKNRCGQEQAAAGMGWGLSHGSHG